MSDLPVYGGGMSLNEIKRELSKVGYGPRVTLSLDEVAGLIFRAGHTSVTRLNEVLAVEIKADRRRILDALMAQAACLMHESVLTELVGVKP